MIQPPSRAIRGLASLALFSLLCGSGLAGYGIFESLKIRKAGNIYLCGDEISDMSIGLCAARVAIVAAMQANLAIEIIMDQLLS